MSRRRRDIVVVGASAGGVEALRGLVGGLPADFPAALFVVLHIQPHGTSLLPHLLSRAGKLPAEHPRPADGGVAFEHGRIYVAPPDHHMVLEDGRVRAVMSAKENRHRPAIDPLFRSAARYHGRHVVGIVLTGALGDGTAGLAAIARQGGATVVQDPDEALFPSMPRSALSSVAVDYCVGLAEMPPLLNRLVSEEVTDAPVAVPPELELETRLSSISRPEPEDIAKMGRTSMFTCPECHGALWELDDSSVLRFRCHVGHALTAEALAADQGEHLEATLWAAVRAFEERAQLSGRMAERSAAEKNESRATLFRSRAEQARLQAGQVRRLLDRHPSAGRAEPVLEPANRQKD